MIHYHGTPLTPTADMVRAFTAKHAMVSFEHPGQIEIACEICQSVVLDNGAFSAWKAGSEYDFDGFAAWAARMDRLQVGEESPTGSGRCGHNCALIPPRFCA